MIRTYSHFSQCSYLFQYLPVLYSSVVFHIETGRLFCSAKQYNVKNVRIRCFSDPNAGKYGLEKLGIRTLFGQCRHEMQHCLLIVEHIELNGNICTKWIKTKIWLVRSRIWKYCFPQAMNDLNCFQPFHCLGRKSMPPFFLILQSYHIVESRAYIK